MARPSDREFALKRKVKELEEQLRQKEIEIKNLHKQLEKTKEPTETKKKSKPVKQCCPNCGKDIKISSLPFGKLVICEAGCGYREVKRD